MPEATDIIPSTNVVPFVNTEALAKIEAAVKQQAIDVAAQNAVVEEMKHMHSCVFYAARDHGLTQRQSELLHKKMQAHPFQLALLWELGWRLGYRQRAGGRPPRRDFIAALERTAKECAGAAR